MVVLLDSNAVFLAGFEAISEGILITDPDLSILFFNQPGKLIFHLDKTALGTGFEESMPGFRALGISPEPFCDALEKIHQDPFLETTFTFSCQEGEKSLNTKPLFDNSGEMLGRIWMIHDMPPDSHTAAWQGEDEELFRSIFDLIPQGIAITDLMTGQFFEVNKHFTQQWGYTREEVIGKSSVDLDFWVDLTDRQMIVDLMKKDGSFSLVPVKMRGKDREVKEILFSGVMISIRGLAYMVTIPLDITDIVNYEKKIWSLASFIEANPNPIFEMDEEGIITSSNEAAISVIMKYTHTRDLSRLIPDNLAEILQAVRTGDEKTFQREISLSDRFFHEYIYVTKQYRTARVFATDITEKKLAENELLKKNEELGAAYEEILSTEEELRHNYEILREKEQNLFENEKKLRMVVDHIPGIVLTTDTDMVIKSIYGDGLNHMGLSPNDGAGRKIDSVFHQAENSLLKAHYQALEGTVSTVEGSFKDRYFVLFTSPLRDASDSITGTIGVAIDITDQKTLEEERKNLLRQLEHNLVELALLNDKIRNPLTVISSLVEMHAPVIEKSVSTCVQDIDDIINNLDKRWADSEKTLNFLQKHYGIGFYQG